MSKLSDTHHLPDGLVVHVLSFLDIESYRNATAVLRISCPQVKAQEKERRMTLANQKVHRCAELLAGTDKPCLDVLQEVLEHRKKAEAIAGKKFTKSITIDLVPYLCPALPEELRNPSGSRLIMAALRPHLPTPDGLGRVGFQDLFLACDFIDHKDVLDMDEVEVCGSSNFFGGRLPNPGLYRLSSWAFPRHRAHIKDPVWNGYVEVNNGSVTLAALLEDIMRNTDNEVDNDDDNGDDDALLTDEGNAT